MAYTATRPWGSAPRARDCISHIALPSMLYLLHIYKCIFVNKRMLFFWPNHSLYQAHFTGLMHDNVLQQDNFCLNTEFVSTNSALSRHSISTNSSVLAEYQWQLLHSQPMHSQLQGVFFGCIVNSVFNGDVVPTKLQAKSGKHCHYIHSLQCDSQYS